MSEVNQDYAVYFDGQPIKFLGQGIFQEKPLAAFSTDAGDVPDLLIGSFGSGYIIVYKNSPPVDAGIWIKDKGNFWLEESRTAWPDIVMDPANGISAESILLEGADEATNGQKLAAVAAVARPEDIAKYASIALGGKTVEHSPFKQGAAAAEASPQVLGVFMVDLSCPYKGLISPEFLKGNDKVEETNRVGSNHLEIEYLKTSSGSLVKLNNSDKPKDEITILEGRVLQQAFTKYQSAAAGRIVGAKDAVTCLQEASMAHDTSLFSAGNDIQRGVVIAKPDQTLCLMQPDHMLVCFFGNQEEVTGIWAGYAVKKEGGGVTGEAIKLGKPPASIKQSLYAANSQMAQDALQQAKTYQGKQLTV